MASVQFSDSEDGQGAPAQAGPASLANGVNGASASTDTTRAPGVNGATAPVKAEAAEDDGEDDDDDGEAMDQDEQANEPWNEAAGGRDERIQDSWQVAFVYAFIVKFTELQSLHSTDSLIQSVLDFERALASTSPSSKKADKQTIEPMDEQDAKRILVTVLEAFQANLPISGINAAGWFPYIARFVEVDLRNRDAAQSLGWKARGNPLNPKVGDTFVKKVTQEQEELWWNLSWKDKIQIMRCHVDYQLEGSTAIRTRIEDEYDFKKQHVIKRDPARNNLVIQEVGKLKSNGKTGNVAVYQIDEYSPRLYASKQVMNPKTKLDDWRALTTTTEDYENFLKALDKGVPSSIFDKAKSGYSIHGNAADKRKAKKSDEKKKLERELRKALEKRLDKVRTFDEKLIELKERRLKEAEAELKRTKLKERALARLATDRTTRSDRSTRNRNVDYSYGSDEEEGGEEGDDGRAWMEEEGSEDEEGRRRSTRATRNKSSMALYDIENQRRPTRGGDIDRGLRRSGRNKDYDDEDGGESSASLRTRGSRVDYSEPEETLEEEEEGPVDDDDDEEEEEGEEIRKHLVRGRDRQPSADGAGAVAMEVEEDELESDDGAPMVVDPVEQPVSGPSQANEA